MQPATADTVLGDFSGVEISVNGVTSRFLKRGESFIVHTDGPDGKLGDFTISYTFGVEPLQQYLVKFPDGRLQALGLAWDSRPPEHGGQRWFHLFPDEKLEHDDPLHWTGLQQNWNYMCADCHTTGLEKNFNARTNEFDTTWEEINVACEACHGPGKSHVEWARRDTSLQAEDVSRGLEILLHDRKGSSWNMVPGTGIAQRSTPRTTDFEIQVCAGCHSRRGTLRDGKDGDGQFLDYHMPAFLTEPLYYPDGQIHEEVYVWGSFQQSRMQAAGVTCSDCHNPHSNQLRAPGEQVCAQCHLPTVFSTPDHHGHAKGSAGSDCLACHMPETTYMQIDPRRDHSIRVPRPDLSAEYGAPDACSGCHTDRDTAWAAKSFLEMFPKVSASFQNWTRGFHQARSGLPQAEVSLMSIASRPTTPDLVRATAVLELGGFLSPLSADSLKNSLIDPSPLVRIAGLRVLEILPPENRYQVAEHLLTDPLLAVRSEAGRVLAPTPHEFLKPDQIRLLEQAVRDFIATQDYNADRPESRVNLGNLYVRMGEPEKAEPYYHEAIRRDRTFTPAYLYMAELYRNQGLDAESRAMIQTGITQQPQAADLHHALGLVNVRSGNLPAALESLKKAAELDPDTPRYAYVYAVALNSGGQTAQSLDVLKKAQALHPSNRDILFALATINRDAGHRDAALIWVEKMLQLNPADQDAEYIRSQLNSTP